MWRILFAFIVAFVLCAGLMPLVVRLCKKLKARQTILHYVDNHAGKSGTPTMGGIGFFLELVVRLLFSFPETTFLLFLHFFVRWANVL